MLNEGLALFVFEGGKYEKDILSSLEKYGLIDKSVTVKCAYDAEVYQLYEELKDDTLDIVKLLLLRHPSNKESLAGYSADDFAYIYLFFDYDAHATKADDSKIEELLTYFNNETEQGMMYLSYPMAEALRHYKDMDSFKYLTVKCKRTNCPHTNCSDKDKCIHEPHYKDIVNIYNARLTSRHLTKEIWRELIIAHLCKMNYLVQDNFEMPSSIFTQRAIFDKQKEKHISLTCPHVAVLSAFPLFLLDYYGATTLKEILSITE